MAMKRQCPAKKNLFNGVIVISGTEDTEGQKTKRVKVKGEQLEVEEKKMGKKSEHHSVEELDQMVEKSEA
eukprot:Nk52_evm1s1218 gene=Nk52_evmTU1s1218